MALHTYAYRATEIDDTHVADLDLRGVRYSHMLNGVGTFSGTLHMPEPREPWMWRELTNAEETALFGTTFPARNRAILPGRHLARIAKDATDVNRRVILCERDGEIRWHGLILSRRYDSSQRTLTVSGVSWERLLDKRLVTVNLVDDDDVVVLVNNLLSYAQGETGGQLNIDPSPLEPSAPNREIELDKWELKQIGTLINELATMVDGFGWAIDVEYVAGAVVKTLNVGYPRRGRLAADSNLVFEVGRNVTTYDYDENGEEQATDVWGVGTRDDGAGGDAVIMRHENDPTLYADGYPMLEYGQSYDARYGSTLTLYVDGELRERRLPSADIRVTVPADSDPVLGSYITGDQCTFIVRENDDPFFVDGVEETYRILTYEVDVPDDHSEELVTVTLERIPDA